jgi:hypothetical protein
LQAILKLVQFKYIQLDQQSGLKALLVEHMLPLYNSKARVEPVPIKRGYKLVFEFDELVHLLIRDNIGRVLYDIFKLYFAHELKGAADMVSVGKESQKALYSFSKEFDICPGLSTKSAIFNMLVDDSNLVPLYAPTGQHIVSKVVGKDFDPSKKGKLISIIGRYFTFYKFLDFLVQIAINAFSDPFFSKNRNKPLIAAEMVILVLERMELSPGFSQIEKKSNRTHQAKATLLPKRAVVA